MNSISDKEIIEILKRSKLKATPQRIAICKTVLSSNSHPSAEHVFDKIKTEHPTISIATIYKTLSLLSEIGLVDELRFNENHTRYDPKTTLHINIVCSECMEIHDYESNSLKTYWEEIISDIDGEILGQRLDVYRLCENCKR
jgi:Fur family peroxide stress response transcriptional regulator